MVSISSKPPYSDHFYKGSWSNFTNVYSEVKSCFMSCCILCVLRGLFSSALQQFSQWSREHQKWESCSEIWQKSLVKRTAGLHTNRIQGSWTLIYIFWHHRFTLSFQFGTSLHLVASFCCPKHSWLELSNEEPTQISG